MEQNDILDSEHILSCKKSRKTFSLLGLGFFLFALFELATEISVNAIVKRYFPSIAQQDWYSVVLTVLSLYVIAFPLAFLLLKRLKSEKIEKHKLSFGQFISILFICFPVMYSGSFLGVMINIVLLFFKGDFAANPILDSASSSGIIWTFIYAVLIAPVLEEFVFRKLIIDKTVRYGQFISVLLSAVFFGLFHGNLYQFFYAFALGCIFAYIYTKTGNILYTIALHITINFIGTIASSIVLKTIDLDALTKLAFADPNDTQLVMSLFYELLPSLMILFGFLLVIFAITVTGTVLIIVKLAKHKTPTFAKGSIVIPKGKVFSTVFINIGVILFVLICTAEIIRNIL